MPDWHCPACAGGYLKQKGDSLHFWETRESREARSHEAWEPEWDRYRFTMLLVCNNEHCREPVAVIGERRVEVFQTSFDGDYEEVEYFHPTYVSPSPTLIIIAEDYPESIVAELRLCFASSWADFSSAGNHIRTAVERLLDHLEEPKFKENGKRLTLHDRIKGLESRDKELSDSLLAIKWLGNQASHPDEDELG